MKGFIIKYLLIYLVIISFSQLYAYETADRTDDSSSENDNVYFTIRFGEGGFRDKRSPVGKLGGDQFALDINPAVLPLAISISSEYYTNGPEPSHSYEIAGLTVFNILYMTKFFKERVIFFAGGGAGGLEVPKGEDKPGGTESGIMYDCEAGINTIIFWKIGIYGIYKYLYAKNDNVIDFSEHIVLLGITFNFKI